MKEKVFDLLSLLALVMVFILLAATRLPVAVDPPYQGF